MFEYIGVVILKTWKGLEYKELVEPEIKNGLKLS